MVGNSSQNGILFPQGITMKDANLDKNKPNNKVGHSAANTKTRNEIKPLVNGSHQSKVPIEINKKPAQSYPKIQPAIAIKPKPTPIAVMPKPLNMNSRKSTFNPNVNLSNHTETTLNINTSKKWVLPPRPRPGRKPTSIIVDDDKNHDISTHQTSNIGLNKDSPKKKMKTTCSVKRESQYDLSKVKSLGSQIHDDPGMGGHFEEINASRKNSSISYSNEAKIDINKLNANPIKEESKEDMDLKLAYLSQLKEQELIRNYIEVLSNQIKELKFVQNGVITFDALNSDNANQKPIKHIPAIKKPPTSEQLENINNINDLNKFISYLSKSSNIIHSVTKKFLGNENLGSTESFNINSQIKRYLEIRSKYKMSKMEEIRKIDKTRQEIKGNIKNNIGLMKNGDDTGIIKTKSLEPGLVSLANFNNGLPSSFTPGLLQNINSTNLFESDDDLIDILNHEHIQNESTINDINAVDKLFLQDESSIPEIDILISDTASELSKDPSLSISNNSVRPKVKSKANCGFCSNNTPCLCLDADLEINKLMNS